jgi:hypothetical protein
MSQNSGFLSNFSSSLSTRLDILNTVSDSKQLIASGSTTSGVTGPYYARYFCIGDLLIQFSDMSGNFPAPSSVTSGGSSASISFPVSYDSTPYAVFLTPANNTGNNLNSYITLTSFNASSFSFHIGNDNGSTGFLAIGPRPSSL